ncbi:ninjurin-A-like [Haematobia irritans]|uniref:ninjurin-A-like n=1 Tax=Haematobia irritans TaxID=7368 RepID=UPI003F4F5D15
MELSVSTGLGRKKEAIQEAVIETEIPEPNANDLLVSPPPTQRRESDPSPTRCCFFSANVKVSDDAIKTLKSGKKRTKGIDKAKSKSEFHTYQQKKTFGQGMMDLALLTANVNQLRAILDAETKHPYYIANLSFIGISIFFQVIVGISLICNSRVNVNEATDVSKASRVNNITFACTFLITVANIFLSVFYENDHK